ncbi:MAG: hypothetical protein LLF82_000293 [Dehalococcoides mccartyi]|uniref:hypothetical protein n=1 Tax=Dehalococcoides mccartyi TaxID=61435 RepID=UPI00242BD452|nr:hypothetical protein [Dehalococcoides mccartyi]MCF7634827.1 hypothetical protein [Dehalococcoides mccartyi]
MNTVKERPVLFGSEMVRAILREDEPKTQTRQLVKLRKGCTISNISDSNGVIEYIICGEDGDEIPLEFACPYGKVGDRLWVKETFQTFRKDTTEEARNKFIAGLHIKSMKDMIEWGRLPGGHGALAVLYAADFGAWAYDIDSDLFPWQPAIFMPRKHSRILLEITNIRIQRIQDITDEEAMAEGCPSERALDIDGKTILYSGFKPTYWFKELWDSIYAERGHGWDKNDWVWVIEFRRVEAKQ